MTECFTQDSISQIDSHWIQTINLTIEALVNEIMRVRQTEEYNKQPVFESRLSNKLKSFIRRFSECGLGGQMNISFSKILNPILTAQHSNNSSFLRNRSWDKSKSTANCNTSFELAEKQPGVDRAKQQISRLWVAPLTKTKTYPINKNQTKCYKINANKPPLNPKKRLLIALSPLNPKTP